MKKDITKYFSYRNPSGGRTVYLGTEKSQIVNTLRYYAKRGDLTSWDIPSEEQINSLEIPIHIKCILPVQESVMKFKQRLGRDFFLI